MINKQHIEFLFHPEGPATPYWDSYCCRATIKAERWVDPGALPLERKEIMRLLLYEVWDQIYREPCDEIRNIRDGLERVLLRDLDAGCRAEIMALLAELGQLVRRLLNPNLESALKKALPAP